MEYFGTDTRQCGHYRWFLFEDGRMVIDWSKYNDLPFHPEYLTNNLPNGEVVFYTSREYTVVAISGSCRDERPGSKSVFWVKEKLTYEEMIKKIMTFPAAVDMIAKMKFTVKWDGPTIPVSEKPLCEGA